MTVDDIVKCTKTITRRKRSALLEDNRHLRADIPLTCEEKPYKMTMFIRRLIEMPENFTVGLRLDEVCEPFQYAVVLVRFQGPHGGQSLSHTLNDLHNDYHIHLYSEDDMLCRRKKASYREPAGFTSYEQAVVDFLGYCNIIDPCGIFNEERERYNQLRLSLDEM